MERTLTDSDGSGISIHCISRQDTHDQPEVVDFLLHLPASRRPCSIGVPPYTRATPGLMAGSKLASALLYSVYVDVGIHVQVPDQGSSLQDFETAQPSRWPWYRFCCNVCSFGPTLAFASAAALGKCALVDLAKLTYRGCCICSLQSWQLHTYTIEHILAVAASTARTSDRDSKPHFFLV